MAANPTMCPCHVDGLYYVCMTAEMDGAVPTTDARVGGDNPRCRVAVDRVSAYG